MTDSLTIIEAGWVIPVVPAGQVLEDTSVVIDGDRIVAITDRASARDRYPDAAVIRRHEHALIPGLINAHAHSPMTLLRGFADDLRLDIWLNDHIWPAEKRWMDRAFIRDGSELAIAEMLRGGITCCNENYFFPDVSANVYKRTGMRATVGLPVIDFVTAWADDTEEYFRKGVELHQGLIGEPLLKTAFAPHAPYSVSPEALQKIGSLAEEMDVQIHMHLHETEAEVQQSIESRGARPMALLKNLGLLSPRLIAVHMTALTGQEIEQVAEHGVHVVHCPESNLKLASGFCEVDRLQRAGINVAVGTDGAASNNDLDLLGEARTAAMLAKGVSGDPEALDAHAALATITINAARAMNWHDEVGSIEPGKAADLACIDLSPPETRPVHHVVSQIIYAASRRQVSDVWVAGKQLLESGALTRMDMDDILERVGGWQQRMAQARPAAAGPQATAATAS